MFLLGTRRLTGVITARLLRAPEAFGYANVIMMMMMVMMFIVLVRNKQNKHLGSTYLFKRVVCYKVLLQTSDASAEERLARAVELVMCCRAQTRSRSGWSRMPPTS